MKKKNKTSDRGFLYQLGIYFVVIGLVRLVVSLIVIACENGKS